MAERKKTGTAVANFDEELARTTSTGRASRSARLPPFTIWRWFD